MSLSTLSSWALLIARALTARGLDAEALFWRAGMDPRGMRDPNSRYPFMALQRLWALATEATQDPCFGFEVAQLWHPTTFHALGFSALASETLREALERGARYCRVVSTGAIMSVQHDVAELTVTLSSLRPHEELVQTSVEAGLASILVLCRVARGGEISPLRVSLTPQDRRSAEGAAAFFRCPVAFGAATNCLTFSVQDMDDHLATANPVLLRANEQLLTQYLANMESSELGIRVRSKLMQLLPTGEADQRVVARSLNLSLRSMQRKLKEEGMTFRDLVDDTRRHLAEQYLKDSSHAVSEIAYLLGFSEVSSFSRAYRRWTGRAPRNTTADEGVT
jgi:AraC-like DNA-binding protein